MELKVNPNQISSRVAVVTGGGRGIGRAMVLGLARAGIQVVATAARERTEIESVAEEAFFSFSFSRFQAGRMDSPADLHKAFAVGVEIQSAPCKVNGIE